MEAISEEDIVQTLEQSKFDPGSPRPKRCSLAVGSVDPLSGEANALSEPPGKYGRKAETQRNRRELAQAVDHAVQFVNNRRTLPGLDTLMKLRRKSEPPQGHQGQVVHG